MGIRTETAQFEELDQQRLRTLAIGAQLADEERTNTVNLDSGDSPYTIIDGDHTLFCDTVGGSITINLPTALSKPGWQYQIKKTGSVNTVILDPFGSETIEGVATYVLAAASIEGTIIKSDGANWWVMACCGAIVAAAMISVFSNFVPTTISAVNTPVKFEQFDTAGVSVVNNSNQVGDRIDINEAGIYFVNASAVVFAEMAGMPRTGVLSVRDGAGVIHGELAQSRDFALGETKLMGVGGLVVLNIGDFVQVFIENTTNDRDFTILSARLSVLQLAGSLV